MSVLGLPTEIWREIFLYVHPKELKNVLCVCVDFSTIIGSREMMQQLLHENRICWNLKRYESFRNHILTLGKLTIPHVPLRKIIQDQEGKYSKYLLKGLDTVRRCDVENVEKDFCALVMYSMLTRELHE